MSTSPTDLNRATLAVIRMGAKSEGRNDPGAPQINSVFALPPTRDYSSQPISWVVENLIAEGTVTLLAGDSGSGKTTLVTAIADAVAHGRSVAGFATAKRPVLMLDRENPLAVVRERLDRLRIEDDEEFRIWGGWCPGTVPTAFSPIVLDFVDACDPKPMIIVDSLVSYLEGSENDSAEIRKYMDGYRLLANKGATVVLLHHTGKSDSAKDYRGSSDIKGSVDLAYNLANLGDPSRLSLLRLRAFKSRFSSQPELVLKYNNGEFETGEQQSPASTYDLLTELLRKNPGICAKDFEARAIESGLGRDPSRDFIDRGLRSGRIKYQKGRHNTRSYTWIGEDGEVTNGLL